MSVPLFPASYYPDVIARHKGYTAGGKPIVSVLEFDKCVNASTGFGDAAHPGARVIGWAPSSGKPLLANPWTCCDAISTTRVETSCWNLVGLTPGVTNQMYAYVTDLDSCLSATTQRQKLTYSAGAWTGSISMKGGTLNFSITCNPALTWTDPGKFELTFSGCDSGTKDSSITCVDPLTINFGNVDVPDCCDCPTAHTVVLAGINIYVVANCRAVTEARHIGYTGSGKPIVARERNCVWDALPSAFGCDAMQCGLHGSITNLSSCSCMAQGFWFYNTGPGTWVGIGNPNPTDDISGCSAPVETCDLTCTDNGDGTMTFVLNITCGATNTGTGTVTVNANTIDMLDCTMTVSMGDGMPMTPEPCCVGTFSLRIMR